MTASRIDAASPEKYGKQEKQDWVSKLAEQVIQERKGDKKIVVASGISPSGQIHLGNLREVITGHFIADEISSRGFDCEHILSWDDFDRLRKVPANIDKGYEQYIGMPLCDVPPPAGSKKNSWSEHFRGDFEKTMEILGIKVRHISQSQMYRSGAYANNILLALEKRHEIQNIIGKYQSKKAQPAESPREYYPYVVYCTRCKKDLTQIEDFSGSELSYSCKCGHSETIGIGEFNNGKLPWKVDWPMRWMYESVDFEPGGVDHCSPGSASLSASSDIANQIFNWTPPLTVMYSFVGVQGHAKMSSSTGNVLTPNDALSVMEPTLLRWMYARRKPNQSFTVGFDQSLQRLYDEWDSLSNDLTGCELASSYTRAMSTTSKRFNAPEILISFRTLVSLIDISASDDSQLLRMVKNLRPDIRSLAQLEPRLSCARIYSKKFSNPIHVLQSPNKQVLHTAAPNVRKMLRIFIDGLDKHWSIEKLTTLAYGVPKVVLGIDQSSKDVSQEVKNLQKEFFRTIYQLVIGQDKGPRLPTLLMAIGKQSTRALLCGGETC